MRTYEELSQLSTFEDRFEYLKLSGSVGRKTFGHERWMNQQFYRSSSWKQVRNFVIARDEGCDLGVPGYEIHKGLYIHHMTPIRSYDLIHGTDNLLDTNQLITVSHDTHNAIHYGDSTYLDRWGTERKPGDTKLW